MSARKTAKLISLSSIVLLVIVLAYWLLLHTQGHQYRAEALTTPPDGISYVEGEPFDVYVYFQQDNSYCEVKKGDRIRIEYVDDGGEGMTDAARHTSRAGGPMPWGLDGKPPDPDLWRSMTVPAMWPLITVATKHRRPARWYPIKDGTEYVFTRSGTLYFGVNLMEHGYLKHTRGYKKTGSWLITAVIDRRAE